MKRYLILILAAVCASVQAQGLSLLAGQAKWAAPQDGTYINENQPKKLDLNSAAYGLRWDSEKSAGGWSWAAQYTNFGDAKTDAWAVSADAPHPGGYIPNSGGKCTGGTCADLGRWVMRSRMQGVALTGSKHLGRFSFEGGVHYFEAVTTGYAEFPSGLRYDYKKNREYQTFPMLGVAYTDGRFSLRLQVWAVGSRSKIIDGIEAPPNISQGGNVYTMMAGWKL